MKTRVEINNKLDDTNAQKLKTSILAHIKEDLEKKVLRLKIKKKY